MVIDIMGQPVENGQFIVAKNELDDWYYGIVVKGNADRATCIVYFPGGPVSAEIRGRTLRGVEYKSVPCDLRGALEKEYQCTK